jgi:hypothetical protein
VWRCTSASKVIYNYKSHMYTWYITVKNFDSGLHLHLANFEVSKFCNSIITIKLKFLNSNLWHLTDCTYRGADKSLARPRRKQANVSVRMAWISFGALPCRGGKKNLMTSRVSMLLKSRASLTCFRACFIPGRDKDLSAPRYILNASCDLTITVLMSVKNSRSVLPVTNKGVLISP